MFAGQDLDAAARARQYFGEYQPSSPSIALLRDGEVVHFVHRHQIEGRSPQAVAADLTAARVRIITRHRAGANVLYGNGSARWVHLSLFDQPEVNWLEPVGAPSAAGNPTQDLIWDAFDTQ